MAATTAAVRETKTASPRIASVTDPHKRQRRRVRGIDDERSALLHPHMADALLLAARPLQE
jgi:hypothetical protein